MKTIPIRFLGLICMLLAISCGKVNSEGSEQKSEDTLSVGNHNKIESYDTAQLAIEAKLFYRKKEYESALPLYEKLLEIDSTNGRYQYRLAFCLGNALRMEEAVVHFEKAAELGFEPFDSYFLAGSTYHMVLLDQNRALRCFEKCLEIQPNSEKAKEMLHSVQKELSRNDGRKS